MDKVAIAFKELRQLNRSNFRNRILPKEVRDHLFLICETYRAGSSVERAQIRSQVDGKTSYLLLLYSRAMAEEAVNNKSLESITRGLVALAVEDCFSDSRHSIIALSLVFHSAQKIGGDVHELFNRVAAMAGKNGFTVLTAYLRRDPAQQLLSVFHFKVGTTEDGHFCYLDVPYIPGVGR